jgi:hypothetical protein
VADAALGKLPSRATAPAGDQYKAPAIREDDPYVGAKPLLVDEIHIR